MAQRAGLLGRLLWAVPPGLCGAYLAGVAASGLLARPYPGELAVVFGNTVSNDGQPSPRLQARLDAARDVYRAGLVKRILVSGGIEPNGRDEAAVMAAYLGRHGIPAEAILEDPGGVDSLETARHVAALLGPGGGAVVVTQWFHVPRAELILRRFGVAPVSATWPRWFEWRDLYSFLREAVAVPVYAFRPLGGSEPAGPGRPPGSAPP